MRCVSIALLALVAAGACRCSPSEQQQTYQIRGQVLGVRPEIREVRLAHQDIPGYMPAMSMSFAVRDTRLLEGLGRGDLVEATLVVTESDAWLTTIRKTGYRDVAEQAETEPAAPPARPAADLLEPGQPVPDATFTDQDGEVLDLASLRGRAVALTFIYTRCPLPNFCPRMDRNFLRAQQVIAGRPDLRGRIELLSISFDPSYDTPPVLKQHAAALGASLDSWRFLTADQATVDRFATRFGVAIIREEDGLANVTHNLRTAVIGPDGRLVKIFSGGEWTPDQLVAELASTLGT